MNDSRRPQPPPSQHKPQGQKSHGHKSPGHKSPGHKSPGHKSHGRKALSNIGGRIDKRGPADVTDVLERAWLASENEEPDRLTHGFHSWPARMHPAVAKVCIEAFSDVGDGVLDPFCGSGTTLIEAFIAGRAAVGIDLNPLAARLVRVKCMTPKDAFINALVGAARSVSEQSLDRAKNRAPAVAPISAKETRFYQGHVLKELAGLFDEVQRVRDAKVRDVLELVFSSMVVKFSRQAADSARHNQEKRIGRGYPSRFFLKKTEELIERWHALSERVPRGTATPEVFEGDARQLRKLTDGRFFPLVVSSPPYGGTYDYSAHHKRRLAWLNVDDSTFEKGEIGSRRRLSYAKHAPRKAADTWDREIKAFFTSLKKVLAHDGLAVMVMGDAEIGERRVAADRQFERLAPERGLRVVAVASQARKDWRGGAPRKEHLIAIAHDETTERTR